jgi:hypothetical protein
MINKLNIRGYINYLYLQRNGSNAPQELLQKWSALSDQDIQLQLQNLYASWNLNSFDSNNYEQMYDAAIRATVPPIPTPPPPVAQPASYSPHQVQPQQTQQARPYVPQKKSSNTIAILLGVLLIGGLIGFGVWWMQSNRNAQLSEDVSTSPTEITNTPSIADPQSEQAITNLDNIRRANEEKRIADSIFQMNNAEENYSDADRQNIQNIHDLIAAEESQNFDAIYSYFSPSMEQYWDISYPTREELETKYYDTWQKSSDTKHFNTVIEKVGDKMYVLKGIFKYFSFKKQQTKTLPIRTFFQFDENGKIVITKDYR